MGSGRSPTVLYKGGWLARCGVRPLSLGALMFTQRPPDVEQPMLRNVHTAVSTNWGIDSVPAAAACQHASFWESRHA